MGIAGERQAEMPDILRLRNGRLGLAAQHEVVDQRRLGPTPPVAEDLGEVHRPHDLPAGELHAAA